MSLEQRYNVEALKYKSLQEMLVLTKEQETQGNLDLNFRVSELQDKVTPRQKARYRKEILKIDDDNAEITAYTHLDNDQDVAGSTSLKRSDEQKFVWQKDLSKRIALKTHPDKLGDLKEEDVIYYTEIYRKSTEAYHASDDAMLLSCGHEVRLKPKGFSEEHCTILKIANEDQSSELSSIKKSDGYVWHHMTEKDKTTFLMNYLKQRGFSISEEQAVEIVRRQKPPPRKPGERPGMTLKMQRNRVKK